MRYLEGNQKKKGQEQELHAKQIAYSGNCYP